MKTMLRRLLLIGMVWTLTNSPVARADTDIAVAVRVSRVSDFYEPLGQNGHWVELAPYGWCWYPAYIAADWQPYTEGYWLYSDGGWYWVSEEPWAWATYHYGRWMWHPYYRWVWVPGIEWAPAWVAWREGGDYVGWAPLPPDQGLHPWDDYYFDRIVIVPQAFVFVHYQSFCRPIHRQALIHHRDRQHGDVIHKTVYKTKIKQVNNIIINEGPQVAAIERASGATVRKVRERQELTPAEYARTVTKRRRGDGIEVIRGTQSSQRSLTDEARPSIPTADRLPDRGDRRDQDRDRADQPARSVRTEPERPANVPRVLRPAPVPSTRDAAPAVRNYRTREESRLQVISPPASVPSAVGKGKQRELGSFGKDRSQPEPRPRVQPPITPRAARSLETPARSAPAKLSRAEKTAARQEALGQLWEQLQENQSRKRDRRD